MAARSTPRSSTRGSTRSTTRSTARTTTPVPPRTRARSATAKRDAHPTPHVEVLDTAKGSNYAPGRMLIASPRAIDEIVRRVPPGRLLTLPDLRAALAAAHDADYTCPITTGIFLRIAAEAAEEERALGAGDVAPWWRVVRETGQLVDKLPGAGVLQRERLEREGHAMAPGRASVPRVDGLASVRWEPDR